MVNNYNVRKELSLQKKDTGTDLKKIEKIQISTYTFKKISNKK